MNAMEESTFVEKGEDEGVSADVHVNVELEDIKEQSTVSVPTEATVITNGQGKKRVTLKSWFARNYKNFQTKWEGAPLPAIPELEAGPVFMTEEDYKKDFLIRLAKSLHAYGSPVYRTEYNITFAAQALGLQGMFAFFPSLLITSFGDFERVPGKTATHILRVDQGLNCEKLHEVDKLADRVIHGRLTVYQAQAELDEIINKPPRFNMWIKLLCFGLSAACCTPLYLGGSWMEFMISFFLGTFVGMLSFLSESVPMLSKLLQPLAAVSVAFMARASHTFMPNICYFGVTLASLVWLLPGLSITISVMELATKNMITGTARFFFAFLLLLELGFGIDIGSKIVIWDGLSFSEGSTSCVLEPPKLGWTILFFLGTIIPFLILLDAHPKQWASMIFTAGIGNFMSYIGSLLGYDTYVVTALSSFTIGIVGTIHARVTQRPAIVPILAGILMLVPGSIGLKGVSKVLLSNDVLSGITFTFQMMTIALSITVGLLFAHLLVFPKRVLTPILL